MSNPIGKRISSSIATPLPENNIQYQSQARVISTISGRVEWPVSRPHGGQDDGVAILFARHLSGQEEPAAEEPATRRKTFAPLAAEPNLPESYAKMLITEKPFQATDGHS
jgi:hypothetical protein